MRTPTGRDSHDQTIHRRARARGCRWIGLIAREAETVTGLSRRPLLPGWAWLCLIGGVMLAGWLVEGRRRA